MRAYADNHRLATWHPITFEGRGTVLRDGVVFRAGAGLIYEALAEFANAGARVAVLKIYVGEFGGWLYTPLGWVSAEVVALERSPVWG